jgi:hypothetical protein
VRDVAVCESERKRMRSGSSGVSEEVAKTFASSGVEDYDPSSRR